MIPQMNEIRETEIVEAPSRTYRLDLEQGRISGMTDGLDAIRQAVFKVLQTRRFAYLTYPASYGLGMGLIESQHPIIWETEIREALLADQRIRAVEQFEMEQTTDTAVLRFRVRTMYGDLQISQEVS